MHRTGGKLAIHPPLGGSQQHRPPGVVIQRHRQIKLLLYVVFGLRQQQCRTFPPDRQAENGLGGGHRVDRVAGEPDPTSTPPPPGPHLGFQGDRVGNFQFPQFLQAGDRLGRQHRNAHGGKQGFCLILQQVHR